LYVMSAALAIIALLLALAEWVVARRRAAGAEGRGIDQISWADAIMVGIAQAAALVPGTSRSGATILGGLCRGLTREAAARFSFLLSIPSIAAAGVFQLIDARADLLANTHDAAKLLVALIVTAIVGYATIPWLLAFLRKRTTLAFVVYRLLLAGILVFLLATGRISS
jgi:undecaprenyl-diphosphatase